MNPSVPVIALVGRPNVGKSTLFNRLTRSRDALVANIPGLTRDRHYGSATLDGQRVVLIDTGGFEPVAATGVAEQMARQTRQAVIEADVVVFVVDGRQGLLARDEEIAQELRRTARKVVLAVNKCEGISRPVAAAEFHALGLGVPMPISATHGDGVHALMEECLEDWRAERERLLKRMPGPLMTLKALRMRPLMRREHTARPARTEAPRTGNGPEQLPRVPPARATPRPTSASRSAWPWSVAPMAASPR